jgi:hypothetical protein
MNRTKKATVMKHYPDRCTISRLKMEEYLAKPATPPWIDYMQECFNPFTKETVIRTVRRDYAPWFLQAIESALIR